MSDLRREELRAQRRYELPSRIARGIADAVVDERDRYAPPGGAGGGGKEMRDRPAQHTEDEPPAAPPEGSAVPASEPWQ
jgi:hypothetical protein